MNKFIGIGNLVKDGELKSINSGKFVYRNTIAIRNDFKNKDGNYDSEFLNFVIWGSSAEYLNKYAKKGNKVLLEGRITTRSYDGKNGEKKYVTEVMAENVSILEKREKEDKVDVPTNIKSEYDNIGSDVQLNDEDLPF